MRDVPCGRAGGGCHLGEVDGHHAVSLAVSLGNDDDNTAAENGDGSNSNESERHHDNSRERAPTGSQEQGRSALAVSRGTGS